MAQVAFGPAPDLIAPRDYSLGTPAMAFGEQEGPYRGPPVDLMQPPADLVPAPSEQLGTLENLGAGIGERAAHLFGTLGRFTATTGDAINDYIDQTIRPYAPEVADFLRDDRRGQGLEFARELSNVKAGYEVGTTWEELKAAPLRNIIPFALEQGIVSIPDMAGVMANMPLYIASRTGEIGQTRAENDARKDATVEDFVKAAPAAIASALLERLGTQKILGVDEVTKGLKEIPKQAGKAALTEAGTEAGQEGIEYVGEQAGTQKGVSVPEGLERMLAGAIGGGPFGGAVRTGTGAAQVFQKWRAGTGGPPIDVMPTPEELQAFANSPDARRAAEVLKKMRQDDAAGAPPFAPAAPGGAPGPGEAIGLTFPGAPSRRATVEQYFDDGDSVRVIFDDGTKAVFLTEDVLRDRTAAPPPTGEPFRGKEAMEGALSEAEALARFDEIPPQPSTTRKAPSQPKLAPEAIIALDQANELERVALSSPNLPTAQRTAYLMQAADLRQRFGAPAEPAPEVPRAVPPPSEMATQIGPLGKFAGPAGEQAAPKTPPIPTKEPVSEAARPIPDTRPPVQAAAEDGLPPDDRDNSIDPITGAPWDPAMPKSARIARVLRAFPGLQQRPFEDGVEPPDIRPPVQAAPEPPRMGFVQAKNQEDALIEKARTVREAEEALAPKVIQERRAAARTAIAPPALVKQTTPRETETLQRAVPAVSEAEQYAQRAEAPSSEVGPTALGRAPQAQSQENVSGRSAGAQTEDTGVSRVETPKISRTQAKQALRTNIDPSTGKRPQTKVGIKQLRQQMRSIMTGKPIAVRSAAKINTQGLETPFLQVIKGLGGVNVRGPDGRISREGQDVMEALKDVRYPGLLNAKGLPPDRMREALRQLGWFGVREDQGADINELYEALRAGNAFTHPQRRPKAEIAPDEAPEAPDRMRVLRTRAQQMGVQYADDISEEDLDAAVTEREAMQDEGNLQTVYDERQAENDAAFDKLLELYDPLEARERANAPVTAAEKISAQPEPTEEVPGGAAEPEVPARREEKAPRAREEAEGRRKDGVPPAREAAEEPGALDERGRALPQKVIAGAERDEARSDAARASAARVRQKQELELRAKQQKMRRAGQESAGGMFAPERDQTDIFAPERDQTDIFGGDDGRKTARPKQDATLQNLAEREGQGQQPKEPVRAQLPAARDQATPGVGKELPSVQGGRGRETKPETYAGADEQRRQLRAGERPLGDQERASAEYAKKSSADAQRADEDAGGVGGRSRARAVDTALPVDQRDERRGDNNDAAARRAAADVKAARADVDTNPTDAQKDAGNYRKGHVTIHGLDVTIENPKGSERSGIGPDGKRWSATLAADYGYFKRTEDNTGENVDVYLGPDHASNVAFIISQRHLSTGKYDEPKVLLGFLDRASAQKAYEESFSDGKGRERIISIQQVSVDNLKKRLAGGFFRTKPRDVAKSEINKKPETQRDTASTIESYFRDGKRPIHVVVDGDGNPLDWSVKKSAAERSPKYYPDDGHTIVPLTAKGFAAAGRDVLAAIRSAVTKFLKSETGTVGNQNPPEGNDYLDNVADAIAEDSRSVPIGTYARALSRSQAGQGATGKLGYIGKHFIEPRALARRDFRSARFWNAVKAEDHEGSANINTYREVARPYLELPDASRKKVDAVLELDRLDSRTRKDDGRRVVARNEGQDEAALSKPGQSIKLTKNETIALHAARRMFARQWQDLIRGTAIKLGWNGEPSSAAIKREAEKMSAREAKPLLRIADLLQTLEGQERAGYVPLMRYGDYYIAIKRKGDDESLGGFPRLVRFERLETSPGWEQLFGNLPGMTSRTKDGTPKVAAKRLAELRAKYPESAFEIEHGDVSRNLDALRSLDIPAVEKFLMSIEQREGGLYGPMVEKARDAMYEELKAGFKKRARTVPGYDSDFSRSIGSYSHWIAYHVAQLIHGDSVQQAYDETQKHPERHVREFWEQWKRDDDAPMSIGDKVARKLTSAAFYYTMAANPSSAIVTFDAPLAAHAVLSAGIGVRKTRGPFLRSLQDGTASLRGDTKEGIYVDVKNMARTDLEREFLTKMLEQGELGRTQQLATDFGAMADHQSQLFGEHRSQAKKMLDISTSAFLAANEMSRAVTALTAYRLAGNVQTFEQMDSAWSKNEVYRDMVRQTGRNRETLARFLTTEAAFEWGRKNRAQVLGRHALGSVVWQFKQFPLKFLSVTRNLMFNMGLPGKAAAAMLMGSLWAYAGVQGLPFVQDIEKFFDWLTQQLTGEDPQIRASIYRLLDSAGLGKVGADVVMRGPLSVFFGADVSNRFGFGDLVSQNQSAIDFMGAAPSMFYQAVTGATRRYQSGQSPTAVAAQLAPAAIRNPVNALVVYPNEGVKTQTGTTMVKPEELSAKDIAARAVGFQPLKVSRAYDRMEHERRTRDASDLRVSRVYGRLATLIISQDEARTKKDGAAVMRIGKQISDIADANAELGLTRRNVRMRVWQRQEPSAAALKIAPRRAREDMMNNPFPAP